jgi:Protein of unknown function (DUF2949)
MRATQQHKLIDFLQRDLAIPADAIALALRQVGESPNLLPMVLWQYGLVSLDQLNRIYDWLETA